MIALHHSFQSNGNEELKFILYKTKSRKLRVMQLYFLFLKFLLSYDARKFSLHIDVTVFLIEAPGREIVI